MSLCTRLQVILQVSYTVVGATVKPDCSICLVQRSGNLLSYCALFRRSRCGVALAPRKQKHGLFCRRPASPCVARCLLCDGPAVNSVRRLIMKIALAILAV